MKILVTCFEPFGISPTNASQEASAGLPAVIDGAEIVRVTLPVSFHRASEESIKAIQCSRPDAIVCLGQAGTRDAITPERVAINIMDTRNSDNDGFQPVDKSIVADGPAAYFSTLPVKAMVTAMTEEGISAKISNSAGTYVCNALMYRVLDYVKDTAIPAGFIHVPKTSVMPLECIQKGLATCITTIIKEL